MTHRLRSPHPTHYGFRENDSDNYDIKIPPEICKLSHLFHARHKPRHVQISTELRLNPSIFELVELLSVTPFLIMGLHDYGFNACEDSSGNICFNIFHNNSKQPPSQELTRFLDLVTKSDFLSKQTQNEQFHRVSKEKIDKLILSLCQQSEHYPQKLAEMIEDIVSSTICAIDAQCEGHIYESDIKPNPLQIAVAKGIQTYVNQLNNTGSLVHCAFNAKLEDETIYTVTCSDNPSLLQEIAFDLSSIEDQIPYIALEMMACETELAIYIPKHQNLHTLISVLYEHTNVKYHLPAQHPKAALVLPITILELESHESRQAFYIPSTMMALLKEAQLGRKPSDLRNRLN